MKKICSRRRFPDRRHPGMLSAGMTALLFMRLPVFLHAAETRLMIVKDPVADVRAERKSGSGTPVYDPLEETQILKGEPVLVVETKGAWARVECIEQVEFTHHNFWEGYPGWVLRTALTDDLTTRRMVDRPSDPESDVREALLQEARRHLGEPYYWGGRSIADPSYHKTATGVDCSGLVNSSFWRLGWLVPRDAHEQWMKARRIEAKEMKPGDLIFLAAASKPDKIVHVAFYAGGERILEAPQTGERVREIPFHDRFGVERLSLKNGETVGDRVIYFGTFFEEAE